MKKLLGLIILCSLFLMATCEKDEPVNPDPAAQDCQLTRKALKVGSSVREDVVFDYNQDDRLVEATKTEYEGSPDWVRRWVLTYANDQLSGIEEFINGDLSRNYAFEYAGNLPDTIRFTGYPGPYEGLYTLSYSGDQLIGLNRWEYSGSDTVALDTIELTWSGVNITHMVRYNNGSIFEESVYEYDDKRSAEANLGWAIVEPADFADLSANNLIRMTRTLGPNTVVSTWNITDYNASDYPLECTWTNDQWQGYGVLEFSYDCN